ncbi:hypothetical protein BU16DRAFT_355698 [Lophium mytilinum]|uniref:Uncharacterized protein n=1 Tax=Lophium mytilinum TaxID=390894 RepID=A0A6A6QXV5_9PEZI|nr:hypothetical protein BU16DRAFT_355698 [Lophium mytilinum]
MLRSHVSCHVCGITDHLSQCENCKLVYYCGSYHRMQDEVDGGHVRLCFRIKNAQYLIDLASGKKRLTIGRLKLVVPALVEIGSFAAVEIAVDLSLDFLRSHSSVNEFTRALLPFQFLRSGRDQECYDFITWTLDRDPDVRLDYSRAVEHKGSNVFESIDIFDWTPDESYQHIRPPRISELICVILIKIKVLLDLEALQNSQIIAAKVPQELLDCIRGYLVNSNLVAKNKAVMDKTDLAGLMEDTRSQIIHLHDLIREENWYFWPAFFHPDTALAAKLDQNKLFVWGSPNNMQWVLQRCYKLWKATPGAITLMHDIIIGHIDFLASAFAFEEGVEEGVM